MSKKKPKKESTTIKPLKLQDKTKERLRQIIIDKLVNCQTTNNDKKEGE